MVSLGPLSIYHGGILLGVYPFGKGEPLNAQRLIWCLEDDRRPSLVEPLVKTSSESIREPCERLPSLIRARKVSAFLNLRRHLSNGWVSASGRVSNAFSMLSWNLSSPDPPGLQGCHEGCQIFCNGGTLAFGSEVGGGPRLRSAFCRVRLDLNVFPLPLLEPDSLPELRREGAYSSDPRPAFLAIENHAGIEELPPMASELGSAPAQEFQGEDAISITSLES
jgi:hypothetical protein